MPSSAAQRSTALLVSSVPLSETITLGLPRIAMIASSFADHPQARQREVGDCRQAFTVEVVDHVEQPEPPTVAKLVADEVERPTLDFISCGTTIGARVPMARRRPRRPFTANPSSR